MGFLRNERVDSCDTIKCVLLNSLTLLLRTWLARCSEEAEVGVRFPGEAPIKELNNVSGQVFEVVPTV